MVDIQKDEAEVQGSGLSKVVPDDTSAGSPSLAHRSLGSKHPAKPGRGRFSKATPEITRAVHNIQAVETRLDHDIARLTDNRVRLAEQISGLQEQLKVARSTNVSKSTIKRLDALLVEAQDRLTMLSGIVPETAITRDRATMEQILKKWRAYDHERTQQAIAEIAFDKNPEDKRAEGDVNRSRAAAYALNQEIESLAKQGEQRIAGSISEPVAEESIAFTHEQANTDKKTRNTAESVIVPPFITPAPVIATDSEVPKEKKAASAVELKIIPNTTVGVGPIVEEKISVRVPTMPQEILPNDAKILAFTDARVRNHINVLFGKKGIFGLGSKEGVDSPNWKDQVFGFAEKTVSEILEKETDALSTETPNQIGTNSTSAIKKIQDYLVFVLEKTSVHPEPEEKIKDYIRRATAITINNFTAKKGFIPAMIIPVDFSGDYRLPEEKELEEVANIPSPTTEVTPVSPPTQIIAEKALPEAPQIVTEKETGAPLSFPSVSEFDLDPVIWEDIHPSLEEVPVVVNAQKEELKPVPEMPLESVVSKSAEAVVKPIVSAVVEPTIVPEIEPVILVTVAPVVEPTVTPAAEPAVEQIPKAPRGNALFDLAVVISEKTPARQRAQSMPQSILPNNPQVIAYADMQVNKHLDSLLGKPGFLTIGKKRGIDSEHWKDPVSGFGAKTVAEILEAEPEITPASGVKQVGLNDRAATQKIQDYILLALSETGVHPEPEESTEDFLRRAAAINIDKYLQKQVAKL